MKIILCRFSNCYGIFFPLYSISLTLAIKSNHLETMSLQAGSKSELQQLKRPREEKLRYIYYCYGFSKHVKKNVSFAQHQCMLSGEGRRQKILGYTFSYFHQLLDGVMTGYRRQQTLSLCLEQKKDLKPDKALFWHKHSTFGKDLATPFTKLMLYLHPESRRGVLRGQGITSHLIFSSLSKSWFHIFISFMFPSTFLYEQ